MSYIPDCRTDANYNEKYLNERDKEFIAGFDWAIENAVDNFFYNNFEKGLDDHEFVGHTMVEELPDSLKKEIEVEFEDSHKEVRKIETIADYVRSKILDWCEYERDNLITSMIDNMDEKEYKSIKERVDARQSEGTD